MDGSMMNVLVMFGGIALFGVIIAFYDWLSLRKDRQSQRRPSA